jgi:hypothetical protein
VLQSFSGLPTLTQLDWHIEGGILSNGADIPPAVVEAELQEVSMMTALTRLHLHHDSLSHASCLASLAPNLQALELHGFREMPSLEPVSCLTNLQHLGLYCLRSPDLTTLQPLAHLTALKHLALVHMRAVSSLAPLACLTALTSLQIKGLDGVSDLEPLDSLGLSLQSLSFVWQHQPPTWAGLAALTRVTHLDLFPYESITEELVKAVGQLAPSLQKLSLDSYGWGDDDPPVVDMQPLCSLTAVCDLQLPEFHKGPELTTMGDTLQVRVGCFHARSCMEASATAHGR